MAEEGWTKNEIAKLTIKEYLKNFDAIKLDALILGCTHYPLFEDIIKEYMPDVEIINTGKVIAEQMKKSKEKIKENITKEDEFFITDTQCNFETVAKKILERDIKIKGVDVG